MPQDQTQVIAGRNLIVYTEPWLYSNAFPADTIAWGTTWGGAWVDKGFTRDGLRFRLAVQRNDVNVDQQVDPVLRIPQRRDMNMETALAQINAANLQDASGQGTISTVAAGSGTRGHQDFVFSGAIIDAYITTGFDILNPGDLEAVRIIGWKGLVMADVEMQFQVTDAARIAFNIAVLPDTGTTANPITARIAQFRDVIAALP